MTLACVPDPSWIDDIGPLDGLDLVSWNLTDPPPPRADDLELVVQPYMSAATVLTSLRDLPKLRAIQILMAGYDNVLPYLPPGVQLCNAAGVHDTSTAELTLALILAAQRGIPDFVVAGQEGIWLSAAVRPALADKRVLLVGYGRIGRAIAARLLPFEVSLTAVATRARGGDEYVSQVHGIDELPALLSQSDIVVLIVPLTSQTEGLIDAAALAAMPDGALLVNMARGKVVVTEALVGAVSSGRIRAALDVTDPEPLPADHPLWRHPGVLISPHVGGVTSAFRPRAVRLLRDQLIRFVAGEPLENVVAVGE